LALVGYLIVARWITFLAGAGVALIATLLYVVHIHPIVSEPAAQYKALTEKESSQGVEKYERRILSYLDTRFGKQADAANGPQVEYPDLAHQVIKSRQAIAVGPCRTTTDPVSGANMQIDRLAAWTRRLVGVLRLGNIDCVQPAQRGDTGATGARWGDNNEEAMAIPVVQFDFTAAFLMSRFGVELGFLVVLLQFVVLTMMIDGAWRVFRWRDGDVADRFTRQVLCFITLGSALLLASQWAIAWGNVLGLLPVMGQPMTWISSSGSHIILVAVPITAAIVVTFRVAAEGMLLGSRQGPPQPTFWQSLNYFLNRQRRHDRR
jgi:cell division protein FtsW (lipid II flippase)